MRVWDIGFRRPLILRPILGKAVLGTLIIGSRIRTSQPVAISLGLVLFVWKWSTLLVIVFSPDRDLVDTCVHKFVSYTAVRIARIP